MVAVLIVLPLLMSLVPVGIAAGAGSTYYVSATGSDANAGTQAAPFKTIQKAANTAKAGDTVYIAPGTYNERVTVANSGTASAPILFTAQSTRPQISQGIDISGSYVEFSNFTPWPLLSTDAADVSAVDVSGSHDYVHDFDIPTGARGGTGIGVDGSGSYDTVSNFAITDIPWDGAAFGPGTPNCIIENGYVHGFGDNVCVGNLDGSYNTLQGVEITSVGVAHQTGGWQSSSFDGDGIHPGPGASNITIRGCTIHDIFPSNTANAHTDAIQWWYPVTNFLIEDSVLGSYDTCPSGPTAGYADCFNSIFMISGANGASNAIIRNNIILGGGEYPMTSGYFLSNNTDGSNVTLQFYNNTVYTGRNLMMGTNLLGNVKNNIFITNMSQQGAGNMTWNHNLWLTSADAVGTSNVYGSAKFVNPDVSAATGYGVHANWHLQAGSPAIGAGVGPSADSNVPTADAAGTARSGAVTDMGAMEYGGATPPDTTPPTTTASFNPAPGAVLAANQPMTLTAADNAGGSGIAATYYKIDSGTYTPGTSFTVTGDGLHTGATTRWTTRATLRAHTPPTPSASIRPRRPPPPTSPRTAPIPAPRPSRWRPPIPVRAWRARSGSSAPRVEHGRAGPPRPCPRPPRARSRTP